MAAFPDRYTDSVQRTATAPSPLAVVFPRPGSRLAVFAERYGRLIFEILFIVPAYTAYQFVRGNVGGDAGAAFDNASRLIHVERQLGIFHEAFLQHRRRRLVVREAPPQLRVL
jgi:hypothetical protein